MKRRQFLKIPFAAALAAVLPVKAAPAAAAVPIPFKTLPMSMYVRGPRWTAYRTKVISMLRQRQRGQA